MKKAIVWGFSLKEAEFKYKEWCHTNNVPCRLSDAIFLSSQESLDRKRDKIRGCYKDVMEDRIKLVNICKESVIHIYNFGNSKMYNGCIDLLRFLRGEEEK